jgi:hypothetical protein
MQNEINDIYIYVKKNHRTNCLENQHEFHGKLPNSSNFIICINSKEPGIDQKHTKFRKRLV